MDTTSQKSRTSKRKPDGAGSSGLCPKSRNAAAQFNLDARIISAFEKSKESGTPFNYSTEVLCEEKSPSDEVPAYLRKIQRGGLVQPFGCLLCIDPTTFTILALSENAKELLGSARLGSDVRDLLAPASAASLARAAASMDLSLLNPIRVCSNFTSKHFYAILHRLDVGMIIDFEPAMSPGDDPGPSIVGAVQSQKLAVRVISNLQALPGGDVGALCDAVAENVRELTGYDRVMVYKFHEDEHGEVVAEVRRPDLEGYLGLHYPAADIPQAARFLFKQNRVRMICDCDARPVRVVQDLDRLTSPLCLVNSTLRAPHPCHSRYMANMGSMASLVMAITVNDNESVRLWGLLVCHHTTVRYVPFPLRHACEFLVQAFSLQLSTELQLASQKAEKKILRTQTMLSDMLMRENALVSVVTGSPTIMDLVRCDGAALHRKGRFYLLGVTPDEMQLLKIVQWLLATHSDSTGLSTDSLLEAGYPGAAALSKKVCGMACARINDVDFMFWFRSPTSKEVKWAGAKHNPEVQDNDRRMHPRLSFNTFLEVVKMRSVPWEEVEINAIHSLQLIMRVVHEQQANKDDGKHKGKECPGGSETQKLEELSSVACEMVRLIETATVPVIAVDCAGLINGWNVKAAELTGLSTSEAMGKSLVYELIHEDSRDTSAYHLSRALQGHEDKDIKLKLRTFGLHENEPAVFIVANACTSRDAAKTIVGVCFVGQDVTGMKIVLDRFVRLQGDYKAIVQNLSPLIPPLFICDENWCCTEWNAAMESLTGWTKGEVLGKILPGEVFGSYCRFTDQDALTRFKIVLHKASVGQNAANEYFTFYDRNMRLVETLLMVNGRTTRGGKNIGSVCFLQRRILDVQQIFELHRQKKSKCLSNLKDLAYLKQELRNPIRGMRFAHQLLEASGLSDEQRKLLETSAACEKQMLKIIEDKELECIEKGMVRLESGQFTLESAITAIVAQVMPLVEEKKLQLLCQTPEELKTVSLCGDQVRLQQVLANFLLNIVQYATCPNGSVEIMVMQSALRKDAVHDSAHFNFRISHMGPGLPLELINDVFDRKECLTHEGLALKMSAKLLKLMGGDVQYVKEAERSYFLVSINLRLGNGRAERI